MGAGKGKSRRAQSNLSTENETGVSVVSQPKKWEEFVYDGGLQDVCLYDYYHGAGSRNQCSPAEYKMIVGELFADAVAVGALSLPNPWKADDFEFEVKDGIRTDYTGFPHRTIKMFRKARPGLKVVMGSYPENYHRMDNGSIFNLFNRIVDAVDSLMIA